MKKLISTFLLLVAHDSFSQSIGTVLFTANKVVVQHNSVEKPIARGASLEAGDTIITYAAAAARIRYSNGTLVTLGADSNYKILAYTPNQSDVAIKAELNKGKLESESAGGAKRQSLKTPVVALAITGTKFKVLVSGKAQTNVSLISGKVMVGDKVLTPGESVIATVDGVTPMAFPADGNIVITPAMEQSSSSSSPSASSEVLIEASGATETSFVTSTVVSAQSVSTSTAANTGLDAMAMASFDIQCFPDDTPIH